VQVFERAFDATILRLLSRRRASLNQNQRFSRALKHALAKVQRAQTDRHGIKKQSFHANDAKTHLKPLRERCYTGYKSAILSLPARKKRVKRRGTRVLVTPAINETQRDCACLNDVPCPKIESIALRR